MSSADFAYILYKDYLRFDPDDPQCMGRDRFVLSAGHESSLLYSILHQKGGCYSAATDFLTVLNDMKNSTGRRF